MTCLIAALCASFPQFTSQIVNFGTLFNVITIAITIAALIQARRKEMIPEHSFKAPGGKLLPYVLLGILLLCNAMVLLHSGVAIWIVTAVSLAIGLLFLRHPQVSKTAS